MTYLHTFVFGLLKFHHKNSTRQMTNLRMKLEGEKIIPVANEENPMLTILCLT